MRLLFCCEFYHPSVGGVQEVMRQLAERMVLRGHHVTVATTRLASRTSNSLNGVTIEEFAISGNLGHGLDGEVERYRQFVLDFGADAILIKAAQQWTFDALWPVIRHITARKVLIPCGFSGLFEPALRRYFAELPDILRQFDHLIFYAERYRDVDFARRHGLSNFSIVPNGADENEFGAEDDGSLRRKLGVDQDRFVFSTVGNLSGVKGHREVAEAFARLDTGGRAATLILNGNRPAPPVRSVKSLGRVRYLLNRLRQEGVRGIARRVKALILRRRSDPLALWIARANAQTPLKQVLCTDLARPDVVALFKTSDLFVFASNIEYSPLVLFEASAAGTPFLTVPVGNAEEIARWTQGGIICPAPVDERGYTRVDPQVLAEAMEAAMRQPERLARLGEVGRRRWREHFTWDTIAGYYEAILAGEEVRPTSSLPGKGG